MMETIVFIHDAGASHRAWRPQLAALADRYRVIAVDLPGHGGNREPFTLGTAIAMVTQQLADRTHLVGHSLGGSIALLTAMAEPDRVAGMVLSAPMIHTPPTWTARRLAAAAVPMPVLLATTAARYIGALAPYRADALAGLRECGTATLHTAHAKLDHIDLRRRMEQVKAPCLVVCGDHDRRNLSPATATASALPNATMRTVPGAGHLWNLTQPELFNRTITEFVDTHAD